MNLPVWSPKFGDVLLTSQLLSQILGEAGGSISDVAITTAGAGTLTAAALVAGQIVRTGPTAAFTDTTDTAAAIVAALGQFTAGETFLVRYKNATQYQSTIAAGAGVTLPPTVLTPPYAVKNYYGVVGGTAAAPTVTFFHLNTVGIHVSATDSDPQTAALTTVGAGTILAANMASGVTLRTGSTAAFTDTTDTAANIIGGIAPLIGVGGAEFWTYVNNTVAPATIAGGASVTVTGATVVPPNSWATYLVTQNTAGTVTIVAVAQGYFPASGTFVCNGATPVTVNNAAFTATSAVVITLKTVGGTVGPIPHLATATPGTGFTVVGTASDTSTYNYEIRG